MKLMGVPNIAIIPYQTCNFKCSYCVANKFSKESLKEWVNNIDGMTKFLNSLDKKMVFVSGGEPMLWDWNKLIKETNHYWGFATNLSLIPKFLSDAEVKQKVKLFVPAFHRECIGVDSFIKNALKLQDMGYSVFVKIVYTRDESQKKDWELINHAGIPVSFAPLVGDNYKDKDLLELLPYITSKLYASRFSKDVGIRKPKPCVAGTNELFEIEGINLVRCGLQDIPLLGNVAFPQFLKKIIHDDVANFAKKILAVGTRKINPFIGTIYNPEFYDKPMMCYRKKCDCEWHTFSEASEDLDNYKWQNLIDTGVWN